MKSRKVICAAALMLLAVPAASASTTWYVNGVSGSDSSSCTTATTACKTIGHAITLAKSGDTIKVATATYKEHLQMPPFSLIIVGSGATSTIIDGSSGGTVVIIPIGAVVTLSQLTIRNGLNTQGAGINNSGTLTIMKSALSKNHAFNRGGGISNTGKLIISNSTLSGNAASNICPPNCGPEGGGIYNTGTLIISNSTITGNGANSCRFIFCAGEGGGIYNATTGTLTISSSTISGNRTPAVGGGILNNAGKATLQNSIVAENSGGNCYITNSNGYNLSSDNTCNFNNVGDLNDTNPMLGTLGYYGGQTQTIPLISGSPAIDAGNRFGCTDGLGHLLTTDQRGKPRPDPEDSGGCDIGAYESQSD